MRQCPRCGAFVPDERQRCDCGHDLSTEAKEADAFRTSTAPPPVMRRSWQSQEPNPVRLCQDP
jgi:hypothetical protein